jgi:hypothetical protein
MGRRNSFPRGCIGLEPEPALQPRKSTGRRQRAEGPPRIGRWKSEIEKGIGDEETSKNDSAAIRRPRLDKKRGGEKGQRQPAVANEFRSRHIKKFNFLHIKSNRTLVIEFKTRGSIHRHLSASGKNLLVFHISRFCNVP